MLWIKPNGTTLESNDRAETIAKAQELGWMTQEEFDAAKAKIEAAEKPKRKRRTKAEMEADGDGGAGS